MTSKQKQVYTFNNSNKRSTCASKKAIVNLKKVLTGQYIMTVITRQNHHSRIHFYIDVLDHFTLYRLEVTPRSNLI